MSDDEILKYVNEWLRYDPVTGKMYWIKSAKQGKRQAGKQAGTSLSVGYPVISISGKSFKVHRIAFLIMTGKLPFVVDHIDRDRSNNRWENLREADYVINAFNRSKDSRNKTGVTGIYLNKSDGTFTVTHGKQYLGRSKDFFEAVCLRKSKEINDQPET